MLELDGPLFDLPFAALVVSHSRGKPQYLCQKVALEQIPSALMLRRKTERRTGGFLGIGDAVYNAADTRYQGSRKKVEFALPRLPETGGEIRACSREWGADKTLLLTGMKASPQDVETALASNPAIIHFATHVVAREGYKGPFRSGFIALSIDREGKMGLLGPSDILAHHFEPELVVLNGCYSALGQAIPSAGLMGLTRAWIAAGAKAVLATRWDVPDQGAQVFMVNFYRALRERPQEGAAMALYRVQNEMLEAAGTPANPQLWASYFLIGRT